MVEGRKGNSKTEDFVFHVGLWVKLVDSAFEVLGGVLLSVPTKLATWILVLAQHEIYKNRDVLAGKLDHLADTVVTKASIGEAAYLFAHGLVKVVLIAGVFFNKRWGYVGLIGALAVFGLFEIVEGIRSHTPLVILLAGFDAFLVWIMQKEYRERFKAQGQ